MEDITDANYAHSKGVCKDFEIKHLGEYHDLYVQMYGGTLEIRVLKYTKLILQNYFQHLD